LKFLNYFHNANANLIFQSNFFFQKIFFTSQPTAYDKNTKISIIDANIIVAKGSDKIIFLNLILKFPKTQPSCFLPQANQLSYYFPPSIFFSLSSPPILNSKFSTSVTSPLKFYFMSNVPHFHINLNSFPYYSPSL